MATDGFDFNSLNEKQKKASDLMKQLIVSAGFSVRWGYDYFDLKPPYGKDFSDQLKLKIFEMKQEILELHRIADSFAHQKEAEEQARQERRQREYKVKVDEISQFDPVKRERYGEFLKKFIAEGLPREKAVWEAHEKTLAYVPPSQTCEKTKKTVSQPYLIASCME